MSDLPHYALLPAGFHDVLPPDAAHEAAVAEHLMRILGSHGYERVKPPLVEFEATLLSGAGAAMAEQSFRLMDPISQRMLALRPDMTLQIARIASARLGRVARPLRLSYAGQVLRVKGSQLRPERQFGQVGAELIGADQPEADAEVAVLAVQALTGIGVGRLSLDLTVPMLVPALVEAFAIPPEPAAALRHALDRKDAARVAELSGPAAGLLGALLAATGPAETALAAVRDLALPEAAAVELRRLIAVVRLIGAAAPELAVTIDFVEHRGFEYHCGVSFALFVRGAAGELGRGGRYRAGDRAGEGEPATGVTLFMDTVLAAAPPPVPSHRLYLPYGSPAEVGARLRAEGWVTVAGLAPADDPAAEARRLGCFHVWLGDAARSV